MPSWFNNSEQWSRWERLIVPLLSSLSVPLLPKVNLNNWRCKCKTLPQMKGLLFHKKSAKSKYYLKSCLTFQHKLNKSGELGTDIHTIYLLMFKSNLIPGVFHSAVSQNSYWITCPQIPRLRSCIIDLLLYNTRLNCN
jgi:hypothetical protein